jgi:orotate phosphoribosyltransferase
VLTPDQIAEHLLDTGAVKISVHDPFTLVSGMRSPIYCDNRVLYGFHNVRRSIAHALAGRVKGLPEHADAIAGTATAGIAWAALAADHLELPLSYVRTEPKKHGMKKRVEGVLVPGQRVALIEDLISTGKSSAAAVRALRDDAQVTVDEVIAIFSYELAAAQASADEHSVRMQSLLTARDLLRVIQSRAHIPDGEIREIESFVASPEEWRV